MRKSQFLLTKIFILGVFLFFIVIPLQQAHSESKATWKVDFGHLPTTNDVVVELDYDTGWAPEPGEHFLVLPLDISRGSDGYSIFQDRTSHWYGGTPVTVNKSKNHYALSYIGLKTSGINFVGDLSVEIVVEFGAGLHIPRERLLTRLLNLLVNNSYACTDGQNVQEVGKSKLVFLKETNGIRWYELTPPIPFYNMPKGSTYGFFNDSGLVRMQIKYIPKSSGRLMIGVAAIVLKDAKGNYRQAKLAKGSGEAYQASLVPTERGNMQYVYDKETAILSMEFKNIGQGPIQLDQLSLDILARSTTYGQDFLEGFSLHDVGGRPIRTLSLQEIQNRLLGKTILPDQSLRLPLFSINQLPAKAIYCPMVELAQISPKYKAPETQGRIISWSAPSCDYPRGSGRKKHFLTIDNNIVLFYINADSSVDIVRLQQEEGSYQEGYIPYGQLLPMDGSWFYTASLPKTKFKYRQTRLQDVPGFEWGLFLEESSAQYLAKTSSVSIVSRSQDFYGNKLTQYKKGNITGFIVDRTIKCGVKVCAQSVLFEIPLAWTTNEKLMAHILWMIRMNDIYP